MPRTCENCSGRLPITARRDARYCKSRCRVAAHRRRHGVPRDLRTVDRWARRIGKRPVTVTGTAASTTRPATWGSYQDVMGSTVGDGIGFMLGDGIACIDLDGCVGADGRLSRLAEQVLEENPRAWAELSMSGTGLHVWGYLPERPGRKLPHLEVYSRERFIALGSTYRLGGLHPLTVPEVH